MQSRMFFVCSTYAEDSSLAICSHQDTISFRRQLLVSAERRFKKRYKTSCLASLSSLPVVDHSWRTKPLVEVSTSLCPANCCTLEGQPQAHYRGEEKPLIAIIGEGPGEEEAKYGKPFIGRSGKLLDALTSSAGFRQDYIVLNTVVCRPPGNRPPTRQEKLCCLPRLLAVLQRTKPKGVVLVGREAADLFSPVVDLQKKETYLPTNCVRTVNLGAMRFLHIRHPSYYLRKGGLQTTNKEIKTEIEDTIFVLQLFKEFCKKGRPINKQVWNWQDCFNAIAKRERHEGNLLVSADGR